MRENDIRVKNGENINISNWNVVDNGSTFPDNLIRI